MEWISNYGKYGLIVLLVVVGILAINWSKKESKKDDDPEMKNVAKAFGAVGWLLLGIALLLVIFSIG